MLHTKFQGHWSIGSGEEDFLRFLPYMGMAAMLVMWPRSFEQLFFPKSPGGCIWNLVAIGPAVSEEKSFEIVDGRRTDGRRTTHNGACLYYKLPRSLRLRWAKKLVKGWLHQCLHSFLKSVSPDFQLFKFGSPSPETRKSRFPIFGKAKFQHCLMPLK